MSPAVCGTVPFVPDIRKFLHRLRLLLVEPIEEVAIHRPAVASDAALVNAHRGDQETFVTCHQIGEVAEGFRCVVTLADMDVYAAHMGGIALCSCTAQSAQKFLQEFDVLVAKDGRDQFGLLCAVSSFDADITLEFPLAPLSVPGAPCAVTVAICRILEASRTEEFCRNPGGVPAGNAVHLDFHPDGLPFHVCNLPCRFRFHLEAPLSSLCPMGFPRVYTYYETTRARGMSIYALSGAKVK